jgi:glycosyltransferase involved in cell wall biosynthesis
MAGEGAPRKVLYVLDSLGLSGRTKGIMDVALNLDRARFEPVFCSLSDEDSPLRDRLVDLRIPLEQLTAGAGLRVRTVKTVGTLRDIIRRHDVQVVHSVNPRPMLYGGLAARLCGVRATIGSLSAFACQVPDRKYRFLPQDLVNRGMRNAWRNQAVARLTRFVVAVSRGLGERFCRFTAEAYGPLRWLGREALMKKLRVISYGVDVAAYDAVTAEERAAMRARLGAAADTVLVGSVGRLIEQKDYPTQLRAFALASRREPRLRMVLAGDGPLRASIESLASELGITNHVTLLGHWTAVPQLIRSLDAFVLASKFEPYGVALLEAKAAGVAIVATRVNEIPSLLDDDASGLLVPPESPAELADAFVRLARNPELRRNLGRAAAADARHRHAIKATSLAYQSLYDDAAK